MIIEGKGKMSTNALQVYHEKQSRQLCALHALNNLFQCRNAFTKEQLDEICLKLNPSIWFNPHRSSLGLGNYDINVIMHALQLIKCEAIWFDKRKDPASINLTAIIGFILNVPSQYKYRFLTLPMQRRHWIAIRCIGDSFYNLDSKLSAPICIGNEQELCNFLRQQLQTNDRELFIIIESSANEESNRKWLK